jgi:WbqC-like protein family
MNIAISQPAYLPWLGYFDLIDQVDMFVLLDSVQFEKQSWQHRNRIKTPSGLQWLTVPVIFRGRFGQRIQDVEIRDPEFCRLHLRTIELNYRRAPFFSRYWDGFSGILRSSCGLTLAELNQNLIEWFCRTLCIETKIVRSSSTQETGKRSELLVNLCRHFGAKVYVSPLGSAAYLLADVGRFNKAEVEVFFQHYEHPQYSQMFPPFQSHASVLDLIFNEGENARAVLRSGQRVGWTPVEAEAISVSENVT